jgi:hypothetical protein
MSKAKEQSTLLHALMQELDMLQATNKDYELFIEDLRID